MCRRVFTSRQLSGLLATWDRTKLGLTKSQYDNKVQVYKRLEKIWEDEAIQGMYPGTDIQQETRREKMGDGSRGERTLKGRGRWDQSNTILIDDSVTKAASQPYNIITISQFDAQSAKKEKETAPLMQVIRYLEELRWQADVSAYMRREAFRTVERWEEDDDDNDEGSQDSGSSGGVLL